MTLMAPDYAAMDRQVLRVQPVGERKVPVTPSFFPVHRNSSDVCNNFGYNFRGFEPAKSIAGLFPKTFVTEHGVTNKTGIHSHTFGHIDWLTIRQSHGTEDQKLLPVMADGCVMTFDADGSVEYTTLKRMEHTGSFDSKCYVRCDGATVEYSGNPARWGRMDNVFGYSFGQSLQIVNQIMTTLGLPPFSCGERAYFSPSWTVFQADRGRDFSVIVDGISN